MTILAVEVDYGKCTVVTGVGETCGNGAVAKLQGRDGEALYECLKHFDETGVRVIATRIK